MEGLNLGDLVGQPYGTHRHFSVCFNDFLDCCMGNLCLLVYSRVRITGHSILPHFAGQIYICNEFCYNFHLVQYMIIIAVNDLILESDAIYIYIHFKLIHNSGIFFFHIKWFYCVYISFLV